MYVSLSCKVCGNLLWSNNYSANVVYWPSITTLFLGSLLVDVANGLASRFCQSRNMLSEKLEIQGYQTH